LIALRTEIFGWREAQRIILSPKGRISFQL
jgi:hypothetical protein